MIDQLRNPLVVSPRPACEVLPDSFGTPNRIYLPVDVSEYIQTQQMQNILVYVRFLGCHHSRYQLVLVDPLDLPNVLDNSLVNPFTLVKVCDLLPSVDRNKYRREFGNVIFIKLVQKQTVRLENVTFGVYFIHDLLHQIYS